MGAGASGPAAGPTSWGSQGHGMAAAISGSPRPRRLGVRRWSVVRRPCRLGVRRWSGVRSPWTSWPLAAAVCVPSAFEAVAALGLGAVRPLLGSRHMLDGGDRYRESSKRGGSADQEHARGSLIAGEEPEPGLTGAGTQVGHARTRPAAAFSGASPVSSKRAGKVLVDEAASGWGRAWTKPTDGRAAGSRPSPRAGAERGHIVARAPGERGGVGRRHRRRGCLGRGVSLGWPRTGHVRSP